MDHTKNIFRGSRRILFLDLIERKYIFEVTHKSQSVEFRNIEFNKQIKRGTLLLALGTLVIFCTGFFLKNEILVVNSFAIGLISILYFTFTIERSFLFDNITKHYRSYNILGLSIQNISFKKIDGVRVDCHELEEGEMRLELLFLERKKSFFGESLSAMIQLPKLYHEADAETIESNVVRFEEIAKMISSVSDNEIPNLANEGDS